MYTYLPSDGWSGSALVGLVGLLGCQVLIGNVEGDQLVHEHAEGEDVHLISVDLRGKEGGGREGGRERGRVGGKEEGREGGWEGRRKGVRERGREMREKEGENHSCNELLPYPKNSTLHYTHTYCDVT